MKRTSISAVVLTHKGAERITQCIQSLKWCDEIIVVVDSDSSTPGESIRPPPGCLESHVYHRRLGGDFAAQRNFGLEKAKSDWVLFLDSDEIVTNDLRLEIETKTHNRVIAQKCAGYYIPRKDFFLGKWLEFGETSKVQLLRLAKKTAGKWMGRVHEQWLVEGHVGILNKPILHYPHPSISSFLSDINRYTDLVAQSWMEEGRKMDTWEIVVYPKLKFFQNYILRLGFLDGIPGLMVAFMMSFHSFLARAKYWTLNQKLKLKNQNHKSKFKS